MQKLYDVSTIPSTGEPGRSASIPIGLQSKARQKISSSNPQLNATLTDDQQGSFSSGKWVDDDEEPRISDAMNMPGNRNSMAETRPSSLSVPGLVSSGSGSRKVLDLMLFFSNSKVNASLLIRCIHQFDY